ncbi:MAG: hypothetical protein ABL934_05845 [Lysobacteraceae bacterium]
MQWHIFQVPHFAAGEQASAVALRNEIVPGQRLEQIFPVFHQRIIIEQCETSARGIVRKMPPVDGQIDRQELMDRVGVDQLGQIDGRLRAMGVRKQTGDVPFAKSTRDIELVRIRDGADDAMARFDVFCDVDDRKAPARRGFGQVYFDGTGLGVAIGGICRDRYLATTRPAAELKRLFRAGRAVDAYQYRPFFAMRRRLDDYPERFPDIDIIAGQ